MIIEDLYCDYQRNGSGGEGSLLCFFRAREEGEVFFPYMATLWGDTGLHEYTQCEVRLLQDVASLASIYMEGGVPGILSSTNHFRSTDYYLPVLGPLVREHMRMKFDAQIDSWRNERNRTYERALQTKSSVLG